LPRQEAGKVFRLPQQLANPGAKNQLDAAMSAKRPRLLAGVFKATGSQHRWSGFASLNPVILSHPEKLRCEVTHGKAYQEKEQDKNDLRYIKPPKQKADVDHMGILPQDDQK